jgi:hypothetical protein
MLWFSALAEPNVSQSLVCGIGCALYLTWLYLAVQMLRSPFDRIRHTRMQAEWKAPMRFH